MILITGGSGYLGTNIAKYLIDQDYQVRIGSSQTEPFINEKLSSCEIAFLDLTNKDIIDKAIKGCNFILHFAAMDYESCKKNEKKAKIINEMGTQNLIDVCKENAVSKFIYLSTMHVYGRNLKGKVDEKIKPLPNNTYSKTHYNAEKIIQKSLDNSNIQYLILRLSNVVAEPQSKNSSCWKLVVHDLCMQCVLQREITLNTDGSQLRDFMSIFPLESVIVQFLSKDKKGGIYNLGKGRTISILSLAKKVIDQCDKIFGFRPKLNISETKEESYSFKYITSKISHEFENISNFEIDETIKNILNFCKKNMINY